VSDSDEGGVRDAEGHLDGLRERVSARGEEALGRIAADLLEHPWVNSALTAAVEARGKAAQAQDVAMDFLNLPSAAQIERLTRRVRSVSQRLEAIEDTLSRLEHALEGSPAAVATRLDAIEAQLADARALLAGLADANEPGPPAVSPGQERLHVEPQG
jgi:septal ring factor EnvC (AmiA/AmiB activator)